MPDSTDVPRSALGTDNVTRLEYEGREILLVGTAHVSKRSVEEVRHVIRQVEPDAVCVELDASRYEALMDETQVSSFDVAEVVDQDRAGLFVASLLFAGFQKQLGDRLGVKPGAEMAAAAEEALERGAKVVLADRNIRTTLLRCYESLGLVDRVRIGAILVMLPFAAADLDEVDVEALKNRETMGDVMTTFARQMPALQLPLIDERDRYLIARIRETESARIVAVVGAAHVPGMTRYLREPIDLDALDRVPAKTARTLHDFGLPFASLGLLALAAFGPKAHAFSTAPAIARLVAGVALPSALVAALATVVAGGGAIAALAAFTTAPLTLAIPFLSLGKITGGLEARFRPASHDDRLRAREDVLVPKLARRNGLLRPLLAAVFAPMGRTLGALIGVIWAVLQLV
ncbi:MAG TPA: TraB family protein [Polyangiaceae bacterium]|nr:TraB family protein [Polyangiaceae bacterium]